MQVHNYFLFSIHAANLKKKLKKTLLYCMTIYKHTFEIQELIFSRQGNQSLLYIKRQLSNCHFFSVSVQISIWFLKSSGTVCFEKALGVEFFSRDTDTLSLIRVFNHYCCTYLKLVMTADCRLQCVLFKHDQRSAGHVIRTVTRCLHSILHIIVKNFQIKVWIYSL